MSSRGPGGRSPPRSIPIVGWLIVVIAIVAFLGSLSIWAAGSRRREAGRPGREVSPREKLARDGGMASFGLNLPWWTRTDPHRQEGGRTR
jgi:hypothetical protein